MRSFRYQQIAEELRTRLANGEFGPGELLPSESSLGATYDASRVTIRKALELLKAEGSIDARQGFGWFVPSDPVRQPLNVLGSIEAQLSDSGRRSQRRVVDFQFVDSPHHVRSVLGPRVLEVRRVNLADGRPFARVTVWCREDLGAELSKTAVERSSFQELLPIAFGGATQSIGAALAGRVDAQLLGVAPESPTLVVKRVTFARNGEAVLVSEHVFPGHLTEFVVSLSAAESVEASPAGMRLVDGAD